VEWGGRGLGSSCGPGLNAGRAGVLLVMSS
jgi:hypothetical protein